MFNRGSKSQQSIWCVGFLFCDARVAVFEFSGVLANLSSSIRFTVEPYRLLLWAWWSSCFRLIPSCQNYMLLVSSERRPTFELYVWTTVCQNTLLTKVWLTALLSLSHTSSLGDTDGDWQIGRLQLHGTVPLVFSCYSCTLPLTQADDVPPCSPRAIHECVRRVLALTIVSPNNINRLVFLMETPFCVRYELRFSI